MFEIKIEFPGNVLILDESMGPNEVRVVRNERQHPIVRCGIEAFKKMAKIMYRRWGMKPLKVRKQRIKPSTQKFLRCGYTPELKDRKSVV